MSKNISPCINLCEIDNKTKICRGCHRTIDEIVSWPTLQDHHRKIIMETVIPERKKQLLSSTNQICS